MLKTVRFQETTAQHLLYSYIGKMRLDLLQSSHNGCYVILNHRNYEHENHLS